MTRAVVSAAEGYRSKAVVAGDARMAPSTADLPDLGETQVREGDHLLVVTIDRRIALIVGETRGTALAARALLYRLDPAGARAVAERLIALADAEDAAAPREAGR